MKKVFYQEVLKHEKVYNTNDTDASASEILATKTAYVNGNKLTGTMPNRGAVSALISTLAGDYIIPSGYHDGSGTVQQQHFKGEKT